MAYVDILKEIYVLYMITVQTYAGEIKYMKCLKIK